MSALQDHDGAINGGEYNKRRSCKGGVWNPMNIGLMVLGFIFFWPVGLVLLFWMLNGNHVTDLPGAIRDKVQAMKGGGSMGRQHASRSGNEVFDEYQQTQLDRIEEIKTEVKDRWSRFSSFRADQERSKAKKEFDEFMGSDSSKRDG